MVNYWAGLIVPDFSFQKVEAMQKLPPAKLISPYQIRGTKLHFMLRLIGFMLGNRGRLAPKIDST